jgi:MFS family permease
MHDFSSRDRLQRGQWLALIAALLGWLFDGAEMGVFSMVGRPAIADLLGFHEPSLTEAHNREVGFWFNVVIAGFLVGAATGGVFFGWLGDRIGRVRAMSLSILVYALFTGLCGVVSGVVQFLALRFVASLGMGGEWSLGVALVMEVWPNRSRAFMAGLIGAAANFGYMIVGFVGLGLAALLGHMRDWLQLIGLPEQRVATLLSHQGWRIMLLLGTAPAILTLFIRLSVPESGRWMEERKKGATTHWATRDLLGVLIGALGPALIVLAWTVKTPDDMSASLVIIFRAIATLLGLAIVTVGYCYPVVRYLQRQDRSNRPQWNHPTLRLMLLAACLSGVALLGTWGSTQQVPSWADKIAPSAVRAKEFSQIAIAAGAIVGSVLAALMGDWIGRRITYCLLCLSSLASVLWLFLGNTEYGSGFLISAFITGGCTASFYGWLPLYLPELFRTNVRATGQGFGYNFGRILAAVGTLNAATLFRLPAVNIGPITVAGGYPLACTAMTVVYLVGVAIIWWAPETKGQPLPV